jgi:hypothetical protein
VSRAGLRESLEAFDTLEMFYDRDGFVEVMEQLAPSLILR